MTYIRILIAYSAGNDVSILCKADDYGEDMDLFAKHYKKLLRALNRDRSGAALVRASKYLRCDDIFVSANGIASISTDVINKEFDDPDMSLDPVLIQLSMLETLDGISSTLEQIQEKLLEKSKPTKSKILLEDKVNESKNKK